MPDISMCSNSNCVIRESCYRYRAIPDNYQTIAMFGPDKNGLCKYYWNIVRERVRPLTEADAWFTGYQLQKGVDE